MTRCESFRPNVAAYVIDNLDAAERDRFNRHLSECAGCSRAVARLEQVADILPSAPLGTDPPRDLEDHVLALVRRDRTARLAVNAPLLPEPPGDLAERTLARVEAEPRAAVGARALRGWPRITAVLTPAFGAAAIVLAFLFASSLQDLDSARERVRNLQGQDMPGLDPDGPTPPAGHEMQTVTLTGTGTTTRLDLFHFRYNNYRLRLHTGELPIQPEGYHYELWLSGEDGRTSAGSFRMEKTDQFVIDFNVGIDPAEYTRVEITEERDEGAPSRNPDVVVSGEIDPENVRHGD
ncbi:MAG: anti-sigma factor [Actinomycetota bacterium]|nr:anti-sigma factor [Actinomycetota bacterium]